MTIVKRHLLSSYTPVVPNALLKMRFLLLLILGFVAASCTTVNLNPDGPASSEGTASAAASDSSKSNEKSEPFKPWDDVLKDTRAIDGVFKTHLKRDLTLYFEIRPDQLGKDYGMILHFSRGIGDFFAYDGLYLSDTRVIRFERVGDQILLIHRNPNFTADEGSPMKASLEENVGHSILKVAKIESENEASKNLLINLTDFFISDYANLGEIFKIFYGDKPVPFDKESSHIESILGFPTNVEIDAALTYKGPDTPILSPDAVSDYRSLPIGLRYSVFALPENPMRPRLADDRVGHFIDTKKDFSRDKDPNPHLHYVKRWRLEKKDPSAALSDPIEPIVYYIDRSVPHEYRKWVREGIEGWNKAFEAAGFTNAVVAKEAPENDSTWSAEDMRYSTVRWSAAHRMGFAIGPSQSDPRTGELLNADILISSEFVRGFLNDFAELGPAALVDRYRGVNMLHQDLPTHVRDYFCAAESGAAMQLGFQFSTLAALGEIDAGAPMPEALLGDAIRWLVLHEVGHTLGLRHNFKGSSGIPYDKLNDKSFTGEHGLTLSVMDYSPVNVAPDRSGQGHYWSPVVGTYDDWAIQYAYSHIQVPAADGSNGHEAFDPADELQELRKIAEAASDPMHAYGTDEDNWLGPWAVDPNTSAWELSSDPLQYARDRATLVEMVSPELENRLIEDGDAFYRLRAARVSMIGERLNSLLPVTKVVGGIYHVRDHKGDPGNRLPFEPVPASRQREALELIVAQVISPDAFTFDAETLNKLAPDRMWYFGYSMSTPIDFPAHEYVDAVQTMFIEELMNPARYQRLQNNELRSPAGAFTAGEMLKTLTSAVWSELEAGSNIDSFRRNLQRRYTDQLIRQLHDAPAWRSGTRQIRTPEHVRSLSRLELTELKQQIDETIANAAVDRDTRAHLLESRARIDKALEASATYDIE